jgi:hypothetical protein
MRTVLFFTLSLVILFATTITSIFVIHLLDASPTVDLPLSDCRLPCFAGAIFEQTTIDVAISQMAKRFEPRGYVFERRVWGGNTIAVTWAKSNVSNINVTFTGEVLTAVGMGIDTDDENMPRLGGLIAIFGRPSCVSTNRKVFFNVYYFDKRYMMTIGVNTLKMDQRIQWITVETLTKPAYIEAASSQDCAIVAAQDWQGFADTKYP